MSYKCVRNLLRFLTSFLLHIYYLFLYRFFVSVLLALAVASNITKQTLSGVGLHEDNKEKSPLRLCS